jgi:hypothetical protein
MQYYELKINNITVDLPPDGFSVEITYRDSNGIKPAGSSSERSVSLLASKNNKQTFYDWQIGTEFKPMYLSAAGVPVLIGKSQLKSKAQRPDPYGVSEQAYQVALYGGNAEWIIDLGETPLSALDWSAERHRFTVAVVGSKFNESYPTDNYGYHFWKQVDWTYADPPPFGVGGNFAAYTLQASPFLFISAIIKKIFNFLGLEVESDFFFNTDEGKGLILPLPLPDRYPDAFSDAYLNGRFIRNTTRSYTIPSALYGEGIDFDTHEAPPIAPDPFTDSTTRPLFPLDPIGAYTPKTNGYYQFTYTLTFDNIVSISTVRNVALVLVNASNSIVAAATNSFVDIQDGQTITDTFITFLQEGQVVYPALLFGSWDGGDTLDITAATLEVRGQAVAFQSGTPIDFAYLLQDWTCADLLKGLTECYNLKYETVNANGKVRIEPKDKYLSMGAIYDGFLRNPTTTDNRWDNSQGAKDSFIDTENITAFQYDDDDDDKTAQAAQANSEYKLHEARYTRSLNRFKNGKDVLKNSFFAPTFHVFDAQIKADTSLKTPLLPLLWIEDYNFDPTQTEKQNTYKPRLLWFGGQRGTDGQIRVFTGLAIIEIDLPVAFSVNYNDETGLDPCLSYGNVTILGNEVQGLAQRFYLQDMARSRYALNRDTFLYLNSIDILNLTFRNKIALDNAWWILKEVTSYKPLSIESTAVILQFDAPQENQDVTNFSHSPVIGFISNELPV